MFLSFLSIIHPNLNITCEIGPLKLAFLHTQISLSSSNDLSLITSVSIKPADTKTILNFQAACPWIWKSGLIKCFINRAFIVCVNWFAFHEDISKLKDVLHMNGYPKEISYNLVRKFLNEKLMTTNSCQNISDEKKYTVIIPFIGHPSIIIKKSYKKNLKSINKKCCAIFKTAKAQNYSSLKDETPLAKQENVVYLLEGSCDKNQTYIGKTKRHLLTRFREQICGNSAILEHISSCKACNHFTIENFHILSHGSNDFDNKVKEALYIKKQKPLLNKHLYQHGGSFLLNVFY